MNDVVVSRLLAITVPVSTALVVRTPTALDVVTFGRATEFVASSADFTSAGNAAGTKPVMEGLLDGEHGPDAAELMPISTTSLPTCVITGPPESPEQMPVVAVWLAVNDPGHGAPKVSGWLIWLGVGEEGPLDDVRP